MTGVIVKTDVSKLDQVAKVRVPMGSYAFYLPSLKDFGIEAQATSVVDPETGEVVGLTYESIPHQWLGKAIEAAAKSQSRNKLFPGTADLRPGAKMPENFLEVVTPTEGKGGSVILAERHALFASWADYVKTLDKSDAVKRLLVLFVRTPDALLPQPEKIKQTTASYLVEFGTAQAEKLTEWQGNYLNGILEACAGEEEGADW